MRLGWAWRLARTSFAALASWKARAPEQFAAVISAWIRASRSMLRRVWSRSNVQTMEAAINSVTRLPARMMVVTFRSIGMFLSAWESREPRRG